MMPYNGPKEYKPLSPWAYWGLSLLYAVPVVGLVFMIIFSISKGNINRRNFTRAFWIDLLVVLIIIGVSLAIGAATGALQEVTSAIQATFTQLA